MTLYTIGHSKHTQQDFLRLLTLYKINCVVDVRSTPFSKFCPQFNRDDIKKYLNRCGVYYIEMGKEFGARRTDKTLYTNEGYLDFEKTAKSSEFISGIKRIIKGLEKDLNIVFMCAEKDPIDCHRNILVAREFYKKNYEILNILYDGSIESQKHLEIRLLDMYFPNRGQLDFMEIENNSKSIEEIIEEAYKLRNKDIGYSLNESGE